MSLSEQNPYCEICPIIEDPSQQDIDFRIHEGKAWRVTLRENQALLGTSFITLKEHKESLDKLSSKEDKEFVDVRNRLMGAVGVAFAPDVVNLSCLMNYSFRNLEDDPDFEAQPHIHYHFKPRYSESRTVASETFTDPEFANYLRKRPRPECNTQSRQTYCGQNKRKLLNLNNIWWILPGETGAIFSNVWKDYVIGRYPNPSLASNNLLQLRSLIQA